MTSKLCSAAGCSKPVASKHHHQKFCAEHSPQAKFRACLSCGKRTSARAGICTKCRKRDNPVQPSVPCNAPDCLRPAQAKGLCSPHYRRPEAGEAKGRKFFYFDVDVMTRRGRLRAEEIEFWEIGGRQGAIGMAYFENRPPLRVLDALFAGKCDPELPYRWEFIEA